MFPGHTCGREDRCRPMKAAAPAGETTQSMSESASNHPLSFLVVGCQRCGTTWLDAALRDHPQVFLPVQKQTYFFDRHLDRGLDWYLGQFDDVQPSHAAVGEIATGYCLVDVAPKVAEAFPDITVLMVVRHPIDRLYSNYQVRKLEQGWGTLEEALEASPDLLARSAYADQLDVLRAHWPADRVHVLFQEDLDRDDRAYYQTVCRLLGVDESIESTQFGRVTNSAMFPRLRRTAQRLGLRPLLGVLSRSPIGDAVRRRKKASGKRGYDAMRPETRARLVEHFRPLNDRLAAATGRDLSHWNH